MVTTVHHQCKRVRWLNNNAGNSITAKNKKELKGGGSRGLEGVEEERGRGR